MTEPLGDHLAPGSQRDSLGCARCGDCCNPVHLDGDNALICTAHDARPDVCREFPWYGDVIKTGARFSATTRCSYLLDIAPHERPEGARPLIPITIRSTS